MESVMKPARSERSDQDSCDGYSILVGEALDTEDTLTATPRSQEVFDRCTSTLGLCPILFAWPCILTRAR